MSVSNASENKAIVSLFCVLIIVYWINKCGAVCCVWATNTLLVMLMLMLLLILLYHIFRCILGLNFTIAVVCISLPVLLNATGNFISIENIQRFLNNLHFITFHWKINVCNQYHYQYTHHIYTHIDRLLSARKTNRFEISPRCLLTNLLHIKTPKSTTLFLSRIIRDKNCHYNTSLCFFCKHSRNGIGVFFLCVSLLFLPIIYIYGAKVYSLYVCALRAQSFEV